MIFVTLTENSSVVKNETQTNDVTNDTQTNDVTNDLLFVQFKIAYTIFSTLKN